MPRCPKAGPRVPGGLWRPRRWIFGGCHSPGHATLGAVTKRPTHEIRALYTPTTVTVYQAYAPRLGLPAARDGRFPAAWKRDRMTWIKPSFLWMMYRCGWGTKPDQETVLAVEISREGFEWALRHACLTHYDAARHPDHATWRRRLRESPARVQWDPERDLHLRPLEHRSLQLGLAGGGHSSLRRRVDGVHRGRHPSRAPGACRGPGRRPGGGPCPAAGGTPLPGGPGTARPSGRLSTPPWVSR